MDLSYNNGAIGKRILCRPYLKKTTIFNNSMSVVDLKILLLYSLYSQNTHFERQTLRKIFGPVSTDNIWRIRNNKEIDKLIEGADIVRYIKAQRNKWLGHIERMDQARPKVNMQ
jgi:hypothetical protein